MIKVVETNLFDRREVIYPATVEILTNSVTGEVSVGWWRGTPEDAPGKEKRHEEETE